MSLYLCVDCGGTKTSAAISDASGTIVGQGSGGPSNITYLTLDAFLNAVQDAVGIALRSTYPPPFDVPISPPYVGKSPFAAAWFGISGADSPMAIAKVTAPLSTLLGIPVGPDLIIANDTHLLAAPVQMHPDVTNAVAVIAGTGSIAVSFRQVEGKIEELGRIGGLGWILGDEGGGFDVGREALRQIFMEEDKASVTGIRPAHSELRDRILERFGVTNVMEILTGVYRPDPLSNGTSPEDQAALHTLPREKRISSFPPLVFEAAFVHNDPLALNILKTSARHFSSQIAILLGEGLESSPRSVKASESVISFGGSLVGVEAYRRLILDDLSRQGHVFRYIDFIDDAAAIGAIGLAAAHSSIP
jgi:N-acetylglucosamine kinase-like BadF-type ATPase